MRNFMSVYSIYDKRRQSMTVINSAINDDIFERELYSSVIAEKNSLLFQFPGDFEVFCLADFNMDNGRQVNDDDVYPYSLGTIYDIMQKFEKAGVEREIKVSD